MASHTRFSTFQKATALVPLGLLSLAWTTSLTVTSAAEGQNGRLPDGTSLPDQAIEAPASVSQPGQIAPGVPAGSARKVLATASTNGIPSAALSAYQRAAQVIDSADKSCHVDWPLIAAIGRVESDHGRYGGNTLDSHGVSRPGIYGIPLDGRNGTAAVADSDAGQYDNDAKLDRAVGPMQFIPSTWSVVGVDGDGDGKRNPQDIDDAALATAVYLCSGDEDLSSTAGQRAAVYRYNHSQDYVDLVLSIMAAYAGGDYSSVPTSSAGTTTFTPDPGTTVTASGATGRHRPKAGTRHPGSSTPGGAGASAPSTPRAHATPGTTGSTAGSGGSGGSGAGNGSITAGAPSSPASKPPAAATQTLSALDKAKQTCQSSFSAAQISALGGLTACGNAVVNQGLSAVTALLDPPAPSGGTTGGGGTATPTAPAPLTQAQATAQCLASGVSQLDVAALTACVNRLTGG
jgi:membrane-bound lytic murein transglycosylase B